jgi:beta-galactosidase
MSFPGFRPDRRDVLLLMGGAALSPLLPADVACAADNPLPPGRNQSFDLGWRFFRGKGEGCEAPGYDDTAWRSVDLPHDWSIEDLPNPAPPHRIGPFDETAPGGSSTGYAAGGEGWYRKRFRLAHLPAGTRFGSTPPDP